MYQNRGRRGRITLKFNYSVSSPIMLAKIAAICKVPEPEGQKAPIDRNMSNYSGRKRKNAGLPGCLFNAAVLICIIRRDKLTHYVQKVRLHGELSYYDARSRGNLSDTMWSSKLNVY